MDNLKQYEGKNTKGKVFIFKGVQGEKIEGKKAPMHGIILQGD